MKKNKRRMKSRRMTVFRSKTLKIMAHKNQKIEKKKEYNPFSTKTLKRFKIGKISGYLRAVKPNPKDAFGGNKLEGSRYYQKSGRVAFYPNGEMYDKSTVYFYEVGANDGSYRKCTTREDAERRFAQLVEFEKRQTEIQ